MTVRRYARARTYGLNFRYGTSYVIPVIRENIESGNIKHYETILQEGERLDTLAGREYGDGRLWWVIAAASNIGFSPQCPPGTRILVPNIDDISRLVG